MMGIFRNHGTRCHNTIFLNYINRLSLQGLIVVLSDFRPHLFPSPNSEALLLVVVGGTEAVPSADDWQPQAPGFCGVLRQGGPDVPEAASSGGPGGLPEACSLLMASCPLDNYSLSQMSSETSVLYNSVDKLLVKLGVLKAFQTRFDEETCGQAKPVSQGTLSRGKFL